MKKFLVLLALFVPLLVFGANYNGSLNLDRGI